jgi:adenosine deaminase
MQSGAAPDTHPLRAMLDLGLRLSINTDDPGISDITLSHELALAAALGLSESEIQAAMAAAADCAFLSAGERAALRGRFAGGPPPR